MSENQPPSYPGDSSGQQPDPEQQPNPGQQQPYPGQQQPYPGQQQPYQGGQPPYTPPPAPGYTGQPFAPKHPQATLILVLGILGLVLCQVLAPFAWIMGNRAVREIDANPGAYQGRSEANAGRICGIIGTVLLILSVVFVAFIIVIAILGASSGSDFDDSSYSLLGLLS